MALVLLPLTALVIRRARADWQRLEAVVTARGRWPPIR
jgi:hypothetical protein